MTFLVSLPLLVWAACLFYEDWRWRRLPNDLLLAAVVLGACHCLAYGVVPFGASVIEGGLAALAALIALFPLYLLRWMGAGDVKLLAVIGWLGGFHVLLLVFLLASVFSGLIAIVMQLLGSRICFADPSLEIRLRERLPFGASVVAVLALLIATGFDAAALAVWFSGYPHA